MSHFREIGVRARLAALSAALLALTHAGATSVKVVGRQIVVNGKPLHLKGVCWNPVPKGGTHPKDLDFRGFVESDSELMARAGINAVRTYDAITDLEVLDVLWKRHIYVLNTVYIYGKAPIESVVKNVNAVKNHPAILMWVVGNEWNYNGLYVGLPFQDALARVNAAVTLIKQQDTTHPVATVHGEIPNGNTLAALKNVDVWGINKYSGISFGNLFDAWAQLSTAPMFLGEYGADAYNTQTSQRDEHAQAFATTQLTQQIVKASSVHPGGVCIGGIIFEFADEWWKDGSGNPSKHDVGGVSPGGGPYPDMTFNEEWWGLVRYDGTPREAFTAYARIEAPGCDPAPQLLAADSTQRRPHRLSACGAHAACRGRLGNCCPNQHGQFLGCCTSKATTEPPSGLKLPSTTWLPPLPRHPSAGGAAHDAHLYTEYSGKFANGHFKVGTAGCSGVGECQFGTRTDAQEFCNSQSKCTAVLLHPFEDGCAGGYGCYTPRYGPITTNSLWDRSGGKAWVKGRPQRPQPGSGQLGPGVRPPSKQYIFVGFAKGNEAHAACKPHGHVAMPKTASEQHWLQYAVDAAQAAGKLSKTWPKNTIWLGGYYNGKRSRWEWNDGIQISEFNWAPGQPSAASHQATEPWLCMVLNGQVHDSDPSYSFGIFCEKDKGGYDKHLPEEPRERPLEHQVTASPLVVPQTVPSSTAPPIQSSTAPVQSPAAPMKLSFVPVQGSPKRYGPYEFVGFAGPTEARLACGAHRRLVMPKTAAQQQQLSDAVAAARREQVMSKAWPKNTIWIGASWNAVRGRWEWDDGTPAARLNWGKGQPSSVDDHTKEPWLCMVLDGHLDDSEPLFSFGVICEDGVPGVRNVQPALAAAPAPAPALPGGSATVPAAPPASAAPAAASPTPRYTFAGFSSPQGARTACASRGAQLAMPKTESQWRALREAVDGATAAGQMSKSWPKNTIWLGGQWKNASKRWEWDDGADIPTLDWADGQPTAIGHQWKEPWLCMVAHVGIHDSDPPYLFGVICQESTMVVRKMLDLAPTRHSEVTWVIGPVAADCYEACREHGGCNGEAWAWPQSMQEFKTVVLERTFHNCRVQAGGHRYDPSTTGSYCGWEGPGMQSHWVERRCAPAAPRGSRRFCPCRGGPAAGGPEIWA